jgi:ABC-type Fe3+ transport system permease subunit
MNRSFLIIVLPAVAVGVGYVLVLRWLGYEIEPFRFVVAGLVTVAAVILVHRHQRRKASRRNR